MEEPALKEWMDLSLVAGASLETVSFGEEPAQEGDPDLQDSNGLYEASKSTTEALDLAGVSSPDALDDLDRLALCFLCFLSLYELGA